MKIKSFCTKRRSFSINRNQLKWLAIIAMTIDHIAWAFVPTDSGLGLAMHFIGRITGPVMCYLLYEGYTHTHDVKKYAARLGLFALLSWPACALFEYHRWPYPYFGVIYTLFLGLIVMLLYESPKFSIPVKSVLYVVILWLASYGDWSYYDVICPLLLVSARGDVSRKRRYAICTLLYGVYLASTRLLNGRPFGWFQFGVILPVLLICCCYNGQSPQSPVAWKQAFHKWFFYLYYPLHLLVLYLIKIRL